MKVERNCIVIYAENEQDEAYFGDTLKIKHLEYGAVSRMTRSVCALRDVDGNTSRPALQIQMKVQGKDET